MKRRRSYLTVFPAASRLRDRLRKLQQEERELRILLKTAEELEQQSNIAAIDETVGAGREAATVR